MILYTLFKRKLLIEAWESDNNVGDDIIDNVTIPMSAITNDSWKSSLHTVEGENGIGNFTLIYYNLTINATSCSSVDIQQGN